MDKSIEITDPIEISNHWLINRRKVIVEKYVKPIAVHYFNKNKTIFIHTWDNYSSKEHQLKQLGVGGNLITFLYSLGKYSHYQINYNKKTGIEEKLTIRHNKLSSFMSPEEIRK